MVAVFKAFFLTIIGDRVAGISVETVVVVAVVDFVMLVAVLVPFRTHLVASDLLYKSPRGGDQVG